MNKRRALAIAAMLAPVIPVLLLLTGCPQHLGSPYGVRVAGDGQGGAIVLYEDKLGGDIYAQKISPDGQVMWGEKGVLLVESGKQSYSFPYMQVISDGAGGAIAAVPSKPSSIQSETSYHIIKIDSQGHPNALAVLERIDQIIGDGSGGVILDYSPDGQNLSVIRIASDGSFPWGKQGIALASPGNSRQIAADGSGGVIVAREELKYPSDVQPGETISTGRIFAQRINAAGKPAWGDGVLLYTTPENTYAESPQVIGDGSGGAIVTWHQVPNTGIQPGTPEALMMDILVQKVDAAGNVVWREGGLPLEINKAAGFALPTEPLPASDGAGGVIVVWRDMRDIKGNKADLYAQRVDASGNILWQPGGNLVSADAINPRHQIISGGQGGAIVSYYFEEPSKDLRLQKIDASGNTAWPENGVPVGGKDYSGYSMAPDGQGGTIVGWGVSKSMFSSEKAYVQRISADGKLVWGEGGIRLGQ